jgi:hypothetical protein
LPVWVNKFVNEEYGVLGCNAVAVRRKADVLEEHTAFIFRIEE